MTLTAAQLIAATGCSSNGADMLAAALQVAMQKHGITSPLRMAHFLAQTAFESKLYTHYVEDLAFGPAELMLRFSKHFGSGQADLAQYVGHPDRIANLIYAKQMGNGGYESGDGWRFRARGFGMLRGRKDYEAFGGAESITAVTYPDWLTTTEGAALSAAWLWNARDCGTAADANFISAVTQRFTGGLAGLTERSALTMRALDAFGVARGIDDMIGGRRVTR